MALAKYGNGIIQLSGSIAGTVYARNRYGNYCRARTVPTNPNSARQVTIRAAVAWLSERWAQTLTLAQRNAWNLYGDSVNMQNRLGETIHLTGYNHYIRSNSIRKQQADTIIDAGPVVYELPEHDPTLAFTASEATQVLSVVYDDTEEWCDIDDAHLYLFVGTPQNAQRNFFAGPWRFGLAVDGDSGSPPTSPASVPAPFGIAELQRLWIYARISLADGRLSEKFRAGPTAVAS